MNKWIAALIMVLIITTMCVGCSYQTSSNTVKGNVEHKYEGKHKAVHGGSLNAIVTCENGHAEVKLDGDRLQLWFVGGGSDTGRSVRVPDRSIKLRMKTTNGAKTLILNPKPLDLAGEKIGDCSYFEGAAPWLQGLAQFTGEGQITFKDKKTPLKIEYPKGYDPD